MSSSLSGKTVFVAGLGLMGASLAKALKKYADDCVVYAFDSNKEVEKKAIADGVASCVGEELVEKSDIVVVALYQKASEEFLERNARRFKADAIVTDLCGLKRGICAKAKELGISFCGSHPMKGREKSGYDASTADLYLGASWIFTPDNAEVPQVLCDMARCVGAKKITITSPENHDRIIAYTSELPHIFAPSYIENPLYGEHKGYCGGSFEDITRVATLNAPMWSEIFCENSDNIVYILDRLISSLSEYKKMISEKDYEALCKRLSLADERKRAIDEE